jgi:O-antigen ligase
MTAPSVASHARGDRAPLSPSQLLWTGAAVAAGVAAAAGMAPFLALALLLLVACAVGVLHSPFVFLWILTALTGIGFGFGHSEALEIGGYTIRINGLRWALIISTCVLILLRGRRVHLPPILRPWLLLVLLAAVGVFWSPVPVEGVKQLLLYAAPLLVALVALYAVTREQDIHALRSALFLAMGLGAIVGIVPFLAGGALGGTLDAGGRPLERTFGTFLLPILALSLARLRQRPDVTHAAIAVAVFSLGVLTLSRTTVATMMLLGLVLVVLGPLRLKLSVGALLVIFTTVALSWEPLSERIFTDSRRGFTPTIEIMGTGSSAQIIAGGIDTSGRGFVWLQTAFSAARTPWRGQGTGSATDFVTRITAAEAVFPHNEYLRSFHDWGVPGLLVVIAAFVVPIVAFARLRRRATRELTRELALAAALTWIAFAAVSVFDNTLLYFTFFTQNIFLVSALALRAEQV